MATSQTWTLIRYGRFTPCSGQKGGKPWKVFEAKGNKPEIVLTILESGYLLVCQGEDSLDAITLLSHSLKVQQKSDNLMLRFTVKGENRMIRMQFDGRSRAEAINECSNAVEKLREYIPVTTLDDASLHLNQPPTDVPAPATQLTCQEKTVGTEHEPVQGFISIKHLTQHFLGETAVTLPQIYHDSSLAQGDLEPILRACLLDPSFHAFVERVEVELRKLLEE
ncbi:meiotic recombination protein REC114 [Melanotaenia boesemani]|uniref:meiotic recombination protein REC114 n=1 Tax=Melanotaenia boesemani TaxID=1250792 RepID=UPI001C0541F8|nr:meiotic recombination protein REC114 [Melanotaenia boesemani]